MGSNHAHEEDHHHREGQEPGGTFLDLKVFSSSSCPSNLTRFSPVDLHISGNLIGILDTMDRLVCSFSVSTLIHVKGTFLQVVLYYSRAAFLLTFFRIIFY